MLQVLRYIAYIALNACVKYCTKDQSNVKGVEGILYRFQCIKCYVMVLCQRCRRWCWAKMCVYVLFPSSTLHSITVLMCIWSISDIFISASQNFLQIENWLNIKKVMCVYVLFPPSTSLTYIALQPLGVFDLSSTSSTCFNIHSISWYGWKALSLSFSKLFVDWKSVEY